MPLPAVPPHPGACLALWLLTVGCAHAAAPSTPVPPWPQGAPGSATRRLGPEKVAGSNRSNIQHPFLTPYRTASPAPGGAAVIIAPGARHGFGVRDTNRGPHAARIARLIEWLAERKFLPAAPRPNG